MKRYKIISELGKGATGVVYRAVRAEDGSTVALKKLVVPGHLDEKQEQEFIRRFKSEAEAALALNHPGIVKYIDCGLDEGTFYIAYELIEGVTLESALKSGRQFSPDEVADIIIQASDALGYAHEQGVVHRDVSTGNIFI
jgi:serine/threonine-protein kinase